MCTYSISVDDVLIERVRPAFSDNEAIGVWVQKQVDMLLARFADTLTIEQNAKPMLSQRLRGIASAPPDFDYKQELSNRFEE